MESLEAELSRARELAVDDLADAIEAMGFECTRCGGCCTGYAPDEPGGAPAGAGRGEGEEDADDGDCHGASDAADREPHTATVFPDEVREVAAAAEAHSRKSYDWRDVARPMPFGLDEGDDGERRGETFEWALATDDCGDCTFYEETDGQGACAVHDSRPLICRTYPFSVALDGTSQPMGEAVDEEGIVRAHECEGLGRDISRGDAEALAASLKERAVRELEEAIGVRDGYDPAAAERAAGDVVVFDSEGPKEADGTPIGGE
ncbi:YkgJ family cysteine cluster protein [Halorubrum sp. HHNYT27]|uniref:YkgJ family cysteine cluster protein n=1 Tax=Halorubrum sp. HHNYT27 TaxID=3402275 RepID=UPI003EC14FFC